MRQSGRPRLLISMSAHTAAYSTCVTASWHTLVRRARLAFHHGSQWMRRFLTRPSTCSSWWWCSETLDGKLGGASQRAGSPTGYSPVTRFVSMSLVKRVCAYHNAQAHVKRLVHLHLNKAQFAICNQLYMCICMIHAYIPTYVGMYVCMYLLYWFTEAFVK